MYYKIQKSLGNIKAVLTDSIPHEGICVEFNNYREKDSLILVYKNGKNEDVYINGWNSLVFITTLKVEGVEMFMEGIIRMLSTLS